MSVARRDHGGGDHMSGQAGEQETGGGAAGGGAAGGGTTRAEPGSRDSPSAPPGNRPRTVGVPAGEDADLARSERRLRRAERKMKRLLLRQMDLMLRQPEFAEIKRRRKRPTPGSRFPEPWQAWIADELMTLLQIEAGPDAAAAKRAAKRRAKPHRDKRGGMRGGEREG